MTIDEDVAYAADRITQITEQRDQLRKALSDLVGAETIEELRQMEAIIRITAAPDADKVAALNAIHALLKVHHDEA